MTRVMGYSDRWSVAPGETVRFMVSCIGTERYEARIVRLRQPDAGPQATPFAPEPVAAPCNGTHEGREQTIPIGSLAVVPAHPAVRAIRELHARLLCLADDADQGPPGDPGLLVRGGRDGVRARDRRRRRAHRPAGQRPRRRHHAHGACPHEPSPLVPRGGRLRCRQRHAEPLAGAAGRARVPPGAPGDGLDHDLHTPRPRRRPLHLRRVAGWPRYRPIGLGRPRLRLPPQRPHRPPSPRRHRAGSSRPRRPDGGGAAGGRPRAYRGRLGLQPRHRGRRTLGPRAQPAARCRRQPAYTGDDGPQLGRHRHGLDPSARAVRCHPFPRRRSGRRLLAAGLLLRRAGRSPLRRLRGAVDGEGLRLLVPVLRPPAPRPDPLRSGVPRIDRYLYGLSQQQEPIRSRSRPSSTRAASR